MEVLFFGVVIGGIIAFFVLHARKQRRIKELTSHGWTFVDSPGSQVVHGLNVPPFGMGWGRRVDDQVIGRTASGAAFQAFNYHSSTWRSSGCVVTMRLPHSMPELHLFPSANRPAGVSGQVVFTDQHWTAVARDPAFGRAAMAGLGPTLAGYPPGVQSSVDHRQLVAVGVPKQPDQLARFVEVMAHSARALGDDPAMARFTGPTPPPRMGVHDRPGWEYRDRDDAVLHRVDHRRARPPPQREGDRAPRREAGRIPPHLRVPAVQGEPGPAR